MDQSQRKYRSEDSLPTGEPCLFVQYDGLAAGQALLQGSEAKTYEVLVETFLRSQPQVLVTAYIWPEEGQIPSVLTSLPAPVQHSQPQAQSEQVVLRIIQKATGPGLLRHGNAESLRVVHAQLITALNASYATQPSWRGQEAKSIEFSAAASPPSVPRAPHLRPARTEGARSMS